MDKIYYYLFITIKNPNVNFLSMIFKDTKIYLLHIIRFEKKIKPCFSNMRKIL